jgi:hypothetical protein
MPMQECTSVARMLIHRAVAAAMLVLIAMASMGVMPSPSTLGRLLGASLGSVAPYPCQDCGCGCAGAAECWTACCCHTPHQRLVWALERGILPPIGVRFADADWIAAANSIRPGSATCGACVVRLKAGLAAGVALVRTRGSAGDRSEGACCSSRQSAPASSPCCSSAAADAGSDGTCCAARGTGAAGDARPCSRGPRSLPCASALTCKGGAALVAFAVVPALSPRAVLRVVPVPGGVPPCFTVTPEPVLRWSRALDVPAPPPKPLA